MTGRRVGRRLVVGITLLLAGCASSGIKVPQTDVVQWEKGRSTCFEIVAKYGPPTSESRQNDGTWTLSYDYQQSEHNLWSYIFGPLAGTTSEFTQATFLCDAQGILRAASSMQGHNKTGTGLISGGRQ